MRLIAFVGSALAWLAMLCVPTAAHAQSLPTPWPKGYTALPTEATSAPSCTAADANNVYCFVVGAEGKLWMRTLFDADTSAPVGRWNDNWIAIADGFQAIRPSCHARAFSEMDCLVVGQDKAVWHVFYRPQQITWQMQSLGVLNSTSAASQVPYSLTCVPKVDRSLECFAIGGDGSVWRRVLSSGAWGQWGGASPSTSGYQYQGEIACFDLSGTSVCGAKQQGRGSVDLFYATGDGSPSALHVAYASAGFIASWGSMNDTPLYQPPGAVPRPPAIRYMGKPACSYSSTQGIVCFISGDDNSLYRWSSLSNAEKRPVAVAGTAGLAGAPPACTPLGDDLVGCYLVAPNGIKYFGWVKAKGDLVSVSKWVPVSPTASYPEAPACVARGSKLDCLSRRLDDLGLTHFGWR